MLKHRILARHSGVDLPDRLSIQMIKLGIGATLRYEGVDEPCEVSVFVTDDKKMRELNLEFRGIYSTTDVLSFPMQEFTSPGWVNLVRKEPEPETGLLPLGEVVFSAQRVDSQAREFGVERDRETAFLTIHSVLHLLGYDHDDEMEKKIMRQREKTIMREIGYDS